MNVKDLFLKYVCIHSTSDEQGQTNPTSARQWEMAKAVAQDMQAIGLENVTVTDNCYVYGWLSAAHGYEAAPALGWIAHMDTAPDFSGEQVHPQIHENYDGNDIALGNGRTLSVRDFPHLPTLAGKTLITTDGSTLLGADDKAGIAEILTAAAELIASGRPHGKLCFGFTPDEEVGMGADGFDISAFGADFAYTVDGGVVSDMEYENFNAACASVWFNGFNVHPGSAKNTMINAALLAMEFNAMLPAGDVPACTEGYQGFFHLTDMSGNVEKAELRYIIRDHDACLFEARKQQMHHITALMNQKYGDGRVELILKEQYRNMSECIRPAFHLIENAHKAIAAQGLTPTSSPIRGGTDGARLSFEGLPCPNLGTGGYAAHGPYEHITVEDMQIMVRVIVKLTEQYAEMK